MRENPKRMKSDKYCLFHKDRGHGTEDCFHLKDEIEKLIRRGYLKEYVNRSGQLQEKNSRPPQEGREREDRRSKPTQDNIPTAGIIGVISGGPAGGDSARARKAALRAIANTSEDTFEQVVMMNEKPQEKQDIVFGSQDLEKNVVANNDAIPLRIQRHIRKTKPKLFSSDSINVPSEAKIPNSSSKEGEPQANKKRKVDEERIEPTEEVKAIELTLEHVPKITKIGTLLDPQLEKTLIAFLQENINVFAWDAADMSGIDPKIMVHRLNVNPKIRPVKQKKRAFGNERIKVIKEEVEKLLRIDYIRPVQYPEWLANVVLVPKPNGKWRMCIDFTDLNKACPKDSYPLPRIDALIDSTSGCELMSFLDAFQGYNQIRLAHDDQKKTSFVTDQGILCYNVMPFGLKNAGATYQRLVNNMFREQIGRNMEVYIDDMMVKSQKKENHKQDLQECFGILQHFGMKLNPTKCTFGVHGGNS
ncbi:UNVERIFIED_CONTAM: Transposon Ty3-G Gag-Pol polyprotein [Sesamum radiatum]|uniref:Transposon Ty3-G Gag-Pol polyprotein n=1 Tax=Sesamum radiatum TaxID=300843 RepID=A0AAW2NEI5_SESRA